jgi:D-xylose transport system substrate-binding protein
MFEKNQTHRAFQNTRSAIASWGLGLGLAMLMLAGCKRQEQAAPSVEASSQSAATADAQAVAAKEAEEVLVGLSLADLKEERWQRDRDFFSAKVESLGGKVLVQDASGDPNAQMRQCEGLLAKGVKVLVVVPKNADAARPVVMAAHAKGVKVIAYDRLIADAPVDLYLSFDNQKVGEIQATAILQTVPKGKYLVLKGDPADKNSDMIHAGHLKVLQPAIDRGDIQIVATQSCDKWLRSEAQRITADALQKHSIDAIVASNDGTASGAIAALTAKGLAGKVPISGQDADLIACQYVWQGLQTVTVYKPIQKLAETAAMQAMSAARTGAFDTTGTTALVSLANGTETVKALFLEPIARRM